MIRTVYVSFDDDGDGHQDETWHYDDGGAYYRAQDVAPLLALLREARDAVFRYSPDLQRAGDGRPILSFGSPDGELVGKIDAILR